MARSWLSLVLWYLGYPDQALAESVAAIGQARRFQHPFTLAYALSFGAWLHVYRREEELVRDCAEELLYLASKHELHLSTTTRFFLDVRGITDGVSAERSAHPGLHHARTLPDFPKRLGQTAAATLVAAQAAAEGRLEEATSLVEAALGQARGTGELYWETELHRCRGKILLARGAGCGTTGRSLLRARPRRRPRPGRPRARAASGDEPGSSVAPRARWARPRLSPSGGTPPDPGGGPRLLH